MSVWGGFGEGETEETERGSERDNGDLNFHGAGTNVAPGRIVVRRALTTNGLVIPTGIPA